MFWRWSKEGFKPLDLVQRTVAGRGLTPYLGWVRTAKYAYRGGGDVEDAVDVQWPFGKERVATRSLVLVRPEFGGYLPPQLDPLAQAGMRIARGGKLAKLWRTTEVPAGFHVELAGLFHRGASEVRAYDELWHRFGAQASDEAIREETQKLYRVASNALDMLIQQHVQRTATYWMSQNRQYRATRGEIDSGKPNCPRCGSPMRKTTYKMAEGQRMRLFACPSDLYLIKQQDVLGPGGDLVEW